MPQPMPVPILTNRKADAERATPVCCSPSAITLTSLSSSTGQPELARQGVAHGVAVPARHDRWRHRDADLEVHGSGHTDPQPGWAFDSLLREQLAGDLDGLGEHRLRPPADVAGRRGAGQHPEPAVRDGNASSRWRRARCPRSADRRRGRRGWIGVRLATPPARRPRPGRARPGGPPRQRRWSGRRSAGSRDPSATEGLRRGRRTGSGTAWESRLGRTERAPCANLVTTRHSCADSLRKSSSCPGPRPAPSRRATRPPILAPWQQA